MRGHNQEIRQIALTTDPKYLASSSPTELILWDPCTGEQLTVIEEDVFLAFSRNRLITGIIHNDHFKIWSQKLIQSFAEDFVAQRTVSLEASLAVDNN